MTIALDKVALISKPGEEPAYSHHGYIITEDGTVYALLRKWWHGAVLALLFPDKAKGFKLRSKRDQFLDDDELLYTDELIWPKNDDPGLVNVYAFQEFELETHRKLPAIRVCPSRMTTPCTFDMPVTKVPEAMMAALVAVTKALGYSQNDKVQLDHKQCTVRQMLKDVRDGKNVDDTDYEAIEAEMKAERDAEVDKLKPKDGTVGRGLLRDPNDEKWSWHVENEGQTMLTREEQEIAARLNASDLRNYVMSASEANKVDWKYIAAEAKRLGLIETSEFASRDVCRTNDLLVVLEREMKQ